MPRPEVRGRGDETKPALTPRPGAAQRPLRVGFVIDRLAPGAGTENQLLLLFEHFDRSRVIPLVCTLREPVSPGLLPEPAGYAQIFRIGSVGGVAGLLRLRRWIDEARIDVLLAFFRDATVASLAAAWWAGVPVITSRRNIGYMDGPLTRWMRRTLGRTARLTVTNSAAGSAFAREQDRVLTNRIRIVPNAIDIERFRPPDPIEHREAREELALGEAPVVACVANLRPIKGHEVLLPAFARLHERHPGVTLLLVGDGPERTRLAALAEALGIAAAVRFLGRCDDVPRVLHAADIGVLSSHSESSSNAVLEYLACGLTVVATDSGGTRELLEARPFGRLAPPGDPDALGDALVAVLAESALSGAEGRRYVVEHHAPAAVCEAWYGVLEEAVRR
jgi:glycosyltransferase involved in cell wall biosynthesis